MLSRLQSCLNFRNKVDLIHIEVFNIFSFYLFTFCYSSRNFENIPQSGPEYSHRNLAIARFLVTVVRINIGGLLSWLVSLSGSVPELTCHGLGRGPNVRRRGCCKSVVLPVRRALEESVHSSCLTLVCHAKFF